MLLQNLTASLIFVTIVVVNLTTFGCAKNSFEGDGSAVESYEKIRVKVDNAPGWRQPRWSGQLTYPQIVTRTYNCHRKTCSNNVCTPESYHGTDPPEWCKNSAPHRQETNCEWSSQCWTHGNGMKQCEQDYSGCDRKYEDLSGGQGESQSVFSFKCHRQSCTVKQCQNEQCSDWAISLNDLNKQLRQLPNCNDVEDTRKKRAPGTFGNLREYCCEFEQRSAGVAGIVRPKRKRRERPQTTQKPKYRRFWFF